MYDLSFVTDALRQILTDALASSPLFGGGVPPFSFSVSSQHPQQPATGADCDLNLYLFHLAENKFLKNSFWTQAAITGQPPGPPRQAVAFEPLCLDLFFILSAQSQTSYTHEQQVMSIAMRALHEFGTVKLATPTPDGQATSEISLTLENPTWDDLSRLWQALTVPLRLSAQYRVGVAMLMPETGLVQQPNPTRWTLIGGPAVAGDDASLPLLFGTSRHVRYVAPGSGTREFDQSPATVAPGQEIVLHGRGVLDTDLVYLITYHPDGSRTEQDITPTWRQPLSPPYPSPPPDGVPFLLRAPGGTPAPGRYGLCLGRPTLPGWRSAPVPLAIAPGIDAGGGPLLTAAGGTYTMTVTDVPAAGVELRLGTAVLTRVPAGPPAAGQWTLSGSTLTFQAPAGLGAGQYAVGLRAADVEADPALWAVVP